MKLKDLPGLTFDALPLEFNAENKIILTHLLHLENQAIPQKLPMIYTTNKIAKQLLSYSATNNYDSVNRGNLVIVEPYKFIEIGNNTGQTLQILFCSSDDKESQNFMVLIRQNGKLNYIYAGNFMDIRSALLNDDFASWILNGVEQLYINLKRTDENHIFNDIDQMKKVFNKIKEIMNCHPESKVHIYLPLFGYANFIFKLAYKFPNRIAKQSTLKTFYLETQKEDLDMQYFCDENGTKIFLLSGTCKPNQAKINFKNSKIITINIINDRTKCVDELVDLKNSYYELYYSPEPSPFQLKMFCMLVKPKRLFPIVDEFNIKSKVPNYLKELCVGFKERQMENERHKLNKSFSAPTSSQKPEQPKTINIGCFLTKNGGTFLSDSESDNDASP